MDSQNEHLQRHDNHIGKVYDVFTAGLQVGLALLLLPGWRLFFNESLGIGNLLAGVYLPAAPWGYTIFGARIFFPLC